MSDQLTFVSTTPWGSALVAFILVLPRLILRISYPGAFVNFGSRRLLAGYIGAVIAALAILEVASTMQLRPWVHALPLFGLLELTRASTVYTYVFAALAGWLLGAFVVAPIAAWLNEQGRANGLLLLLFCVVVGAFGGAAMSFAWARPRSELGFSVASMAVVLSCLAVGFSLGADLPLRVISRGA